MFTLRLSVLGFGVLVAAIPDQDIIISYGEIIQNSIYELEGSAEQVFPSALASGRQKGIYSPTPEGRISEQRE
ncbi:hypothetical protein N7499_003518 [Penicillium canescens]|uniref:Uncharacterized protein n=1 Tax=Penicillium canescens TaxID=5083 RepID=A0AAD6I930_PENCN|nr:uncharacterized protein N7446_012444 [Penicillium canescens]KAJ6020228.1 hypothetical protein N7522_000303 [Penicillium canescens]KAJ6038182.1 hypothetical protein N7460_007953 [Penicillium canescens]KAJ6045580.1 hypothetical protein N7446_012444 [Penicillium canescens]KAJ6061265.1 hypothetical protein N7444_001961 [Penicillium canescens]KAJ6090804.1 hypothetical protein N7499_003518 [Penicillium canescens]